MSDEVVICCPFCAQIVEYIEIPDDALEDEERCAQATYEDQKLWKAIKKHECKHYNK